MENQYPKRILYARKKVSEIESGISFRNGNNNSIMKNRIAEIRKASGISQEKLGMCLNIQKAGMQKIEKRAIEDITIGDLFKLANYLNCHPWELMGLEQKPTIDYNGVSEKISMMSHQISILTDEIAELRDPEKFSAAKQNAAYDKAIPSSQK